MLIRVRKIKVGHDTCPAYAGVSSLGVPGVPWHTQILADQLTLFQPDCAHLITTGTPGFSDLPTALQYDESFYLQTLKQWKFPSTYKCLNHTSDLPKRCKKATCHWSSTDLERNCLKSRWNYKQVARASIQCVSYFYTPLDFCWKSG